MSSSKLLLISLFFSLCIYNSASKASEQLLATVRTNVSNTSYQIFLVIDDNQRTLKSFHIDNIINGKSEIIDSLDVQSFINKGLKLPKKTKFSFVKINGNHFDQFLGGRINFDILNNILTGKRSSYELYLAQEKNQWKLFSGDKAVNTILAIVNKVPVIGIVGTSELIIN